ncbi:hypothetical protein LX36DRAFT_653573 [Colletotrichum falcatum]|nr:hypothetical protein LX36DRAFT_653573 [Colletotrichum falcatum]
MPPPLFASFLACFFPFAPLLVAGPLPPLSFVPSLLPAPLNDVFATANFRSHIDRFLFDSFC